MANETGLQGYVPWVLDAGTIRPMNATDLSGSTLTAPVKSLSSVTATGAGSVLTVTGAALGEWTLQVVIEAGGPTTLVVALELSLDNTNWYEAERFDIALGHASGDMRVAWAAAQYARANLLSIVGGGTISAWVAGS